MNLNETSASRWTDPNTPYTTNGSARRLDSDKGRYYEISSAGAATIKVPAVSTIISSELSKNFLRDWSLRLMGDYLMEVIPTNTAITYEQLATSVAAGQVRHKEVMTASAAWGTLVHDAVQIRLASGKYPKGTRENQELHTCLRVFEDWWQSQRLTFVAAEQPCWSRTFQYAGTFDFLAKDVYGRHYLFDWKTSRQWSEAFPLQASSYAHAIEESSNVRVDELRIVRIGRDFKVEVLIITPEEREQLFQVFLALRSVWEWRRTYRCKPVTFCKKMS